MTDPMSKQRGKHQPPPSDAAAQSRPAIRHAYARHGVPDFYRRFGADYRNPHEPAIRALLQQSVPVWQLNLSQVLDLACGSGEITRCLRELGAGSIDGVDPYTGQAYVQRTGQTALPFSFEQVAAGALDDRHYSTIFCSFALHLLEPSRLPALALRLSQIADA